MKNVLTVKEHDKLLQDDVLRKKHRNTYPCWTSTHLKYKGTDCEITENGKTVKCKIPERNGWYKQNEFGLPFGEPSNAQDPDARHLWRWSEYEGLVLRGGYWGGDARRVVGCLGGPLYRYGVLVWDKPAGKHKHEWVCKLCGEKKG